MGGSFPEDTAVTLASHLESIQQEVSAWQEHSDGHSAKVTGDMSTGTEALLLRQVRPYS